MSSLYGSEYADKYENNKYIWENEKDKNSQKAKQANERKNNKPKAAAKEMSLPLCILYRWSKKEDGI